MLELLERNHYVVRVQQLANGVIKASFPKTTLINPDMPQFTATYWPRYGKKNAEIFITKTGGEYLKEYAAVAANYAARNYISLDILTALRQLGLSSRIVLYYNESGEKVEGFTDVIPGVEIEKEAILTDLYLAGQNEGFAKFVKPAKKARVYEGYKLLSESFN